MGFKNKLSKIKSFFIDEVDEEKETRRPIKSIIKKEEPKERVKEIEIPTKEISVVDDFMFDDISDEEPKEEIKLRTEAKEQEFSFPEFDDDDFSVAEEKPEPIIKPERKEPKPVPLYQGSKRKEENKKFKPSPRISPIYGLLDDEGNTVKEEQKEFISGYNDEATLDDVRRKAYGRLDDELEDTMKRLSSKTIEEAEEEAKKDEEELSRVKSKKEEEEVKVISDLSKPIEEDDDDDDDMILPNVKFKEIDVDKETKKSKKKKAEPTKEEPKKEDQDDDDDDDTKEQDLFNLIDTMYQEEGDEE